MIRRRSLLALAIACATLPVGSIAGAQEASPAAGTPAADPIVCSVEPRNVDELLALWFDEAGGPAATPAAAAAIPEEEVALSGERADEETVAAITELTQQWIFCVDGVGQHVRAFNLMTDDLAAQFGPDLSADVPASLDEVRATLEAQIIGTPVAAPQITRIPGLAGPRRTTILDDGRAVAIWSFGGDKILFYYEQQDGGNWLIDETIDLIETAAEGTPTP